MENLIRDCSILIEQIDLTVDLLVKQNMESAVDELLILIDMMSGTIETILVNKAPLMEMGIEVDERHIIDSLNQVMEAISNNDFVLVADLLNYELKEMFQRFLENVSR